MYRERMRAINDTLQLSAKSPTTRIGYSAPHRIKKIASNSTIIRGKSGNLIDLIKRDINHMTLQTISRYIIIAGLIALGSPTTMAQTQLSSRHIKNTDSDN